MYYILPTIPTPAMLTGTSLAEDPRPAWNQGGTYNAGDEVHLLLTHRVYRCAVAGTSSVRPDLDPTRWTDMFATNKWAPFDYYSSVGAGAADSITYVVRPGYVNAIALYGLAGDRYDLTLRNGPGGPVIFHAEGGLFEDAVGWYEYYFTEPGQKTRLKFLNLPIRPDVEITLTIWGATAKIGKFVFGDQVSLVDSTQGGTEFGAQAEPTTYSYIKTEPDGSTKIVRRHKSSNLRARIRLPRDRADLAVEKLKRVLDVPVAWIATDIPGYAGLDVFGLCSSAPVSYDSPNTASIDINIKGFI